MSVFGTFFMSKIQFCNKHIRSIEMCIRSIVS